VSGSADSRPRKLSFTGYVFSCAMLLASLSSSIVAAGEVFYIEVKMADGRIDPKTKQSVIFVKLTDDSKRVVAELTQKNVGKVAEFRVDGRVLMKPVIREPLLGGVFEISGNYSLNEAKDIAKRMSSGTKIEIEIVAE
jgi:preprotein translocase subunit SecD